MSDNNYLELVQGLRSVNELVVCLHRCRCDSDERNGRRPKRCVSSSFPGEVRACGRGLPRCLGVSSGSSRISRRLGFIGEFGRAAHDTAQSVTDVRLSARDGRHPIVFSPRRAVANMLLVTAFKLCYPVRIFVYVKRNNFSQLTGGLLLRFHELALPPNTASANATITISQDKLGALAQSAPIFGRDLHVEPVGVEKIDRRYSVICLKGVPRPSIRQFVVDLIR